MKRVCKSVLMCLLLAAVVLCLAGCGGGAGGNPDGNNIVYSSLNWLEEEPCFIVIYQSGKKATFYLREQDSQLMLTISYGSSVSEGYFNKVLIQGAVTALDVSSVDEGTIYFSVAGNKSAINQYLPANSSTWYVDLTSDDYPSRDISFTIPSQYVSQIKEWLEAWTPPSN